ncbi:MAG: hypothetical protein P8Z79_15600, partial [Sedimentisphaerales bacterium]
MFWLTGNRMKLIVVGILAAMVFGGGSAKADFTFGTPKNLGPTVNSNTGDYSPDISVDGLELYFDSRRESDTKDVDIWVVKRETINDEWSKPENLGEFINSDEEDSHPNLSSDGLTLYFSSFSPEGMGGGDLWMTTRATRNDPWGPAVNLGPTLNNTEHQTAPSISADELELYFSYYDPDLPEDDPAQGFYVTRRESKDAPWGEPINLGPVINSWPCRWEIEISSDGLLLMWADYWDCEPRPGGHGETDICYSRRATKDSEWGEPVNLGACINTTSSEAGPSISPDGSMLYFQSNHCGGQAMDIWQAPILPVVDFDDDGSVGISDLLMLVEAWETDDPKCDIGPMPWGDGVVDAADLDVLMNHWGLDPDTGSKPIELVAHWALDEIEGMKAYDSAGTCDANLVGDPVWQPGGGMVGGALELDGIGDYVSTPYIVPRTAEAFSLFAWVKGGARNQVIASETGMYGYFLLQADFKAGNLMTSLYGGFDGDYLFSETPIIDGQWHHVGLVWDGYPANRILYVDGVEVARNTAGGCSTGGSIGGRGIYIGAS